MVKLNWQYLLVLTVVSIFPCADVFSSSTVPLSPEQRADLADAICIGTVMGNRPFRSPQPNAIYTESRIRIDEPLKGVFPKIIRLIHRGGMIGHEAEIDGFAPQLAVQEQYLFYLTRRSDGTLYAMEGSPSAIPLRRKLHSHRMETVLRRIRRKRSRLRDWGDNVTDQALEDTSTPYSSWEGTIAVANGSLMGLIPDLNGISSRFTTTDRGQPIPYIIDAELLPAGITLEEATNAVANAFHAWSEVTSLQFKFEGFDVFGLAANNIDDQSEKIYIQLHDKHNAISGPTTLGIGGRSSFSTSGFPNGGTGGRVGPHEFHASRRGFVILKHTAVALQTLSTFEEVLCHEVGHALSMAHSSEDLGETNDLLSEAIMFFQVHADERGATLGDYDPPVIQQAYPELNTPPYGFDRVIYYVTSFTPLNHPEVNQVELKGYDLQGDALSRVLLNESGMNGSFNLNGMIATYTPNGILNNPGDPFDPAGVSFFDQVYIRFDDGINLSPPLRLRVLDFSIDTSPADNLDGIPDNWMIANFGNNTPIHGISGADDDPDGDGLTNMREYQGGSNPLSPISTFKVKTFTAEEIQWTARPFELYEVLISKDLSTWELVTPPILPTTDIGLASGIFDFQSSNQFIRIRKVP